MYICDVIKKLESEDLTQIVPVGFSGEPGLNDDDDFVAEFKIKENATIKEMLDSCKKAISEFGVSEFDNVFIENPIGESECLSETLLMYMISFSNPKQDIFVRNLRRRVEAAKYWARRNSQKVWWKVFYYLQKPNFYLILLGIILGYVFGMRTK